MHNFIIFHIFVHLHANAAFVDLNSVYTLCFQNSIEKTKHHYEQNNFGRKQHYPLTSLCRLFLGCIVLNLGDNLEAGYNEADQNQHTEYSAHADQSIQRCLPHQLSHARLGIQGCGLHLPEHVVGQNDLRRPVLLLTDDFYLDDDLITIDLSADFAHLGYCSHGSHCGIEGTDGRGERISVHFKAQLALQHILDLLRRVLVQIMYTHVVHILRQYRNDVV